ncbi:MAG: AMP-binding protein, partial [Coriobacteriaceae bacterium]|nr:AMP-binding protein [Coriobacteriaceae bacterium]
MIPGLRIDEQHKALYYEKGYWTTHTLNDIWIERVRNHGDKEYVADDQGSRLTYREVDDRAARLASWLAGHGVAVGDVVSFQIPTWAEFSIVYVACLKVGAVMHPLSWKFNDEDLVYNMNKVGTKAFICPTYFHKCDYEKMALDIADRIPSLGSVALIDKVEPSLHGLPTLSSVARASQPLTAKPAVSADDVACILTTSGTTGKSKEVMLTHNNLVFSERSFV